MKMNKEKINRINELYKKSKSQGLTADEKAEQQCLRDEFRANFRRNFSSQLENVHLVDEDGNLIKPSKCKDQ